MENSGREYGLQPGLLKGEIEHSVVNKSNFTDLGNIWVPCRRLDVLCLAFKKARLSMEMQNISGFGSEDCLTEASLGGNALEKTIKVEKFIRLTTSMFEILCVNQSKVVEYCLKQKFWTKLVWRNTNYY